MAIQVRRGQKADFDPSKMLPGEWAVSIDSDTDNQIVWMCFRAGVVKRMGTYEDFKQQIEEAMDEIKEEYLAEFQVILEQIETLASKTQENTDTVIQIRNDTVNTYIPQMFEYFTGCEENAQKALNAESMAANRVLESESYAHGGTGMRTGEETDNAKYYSDSAAESANNAAGSAESASCSAEEAGISATNAKDSETNASEAAKTAVEKANNAENSATNAENLVQEALDILEKGSLVGAQGIQGPQGERGEKGEQGLQGAMGPTGATGPQGEQGIQGVAGADGEKGEKGDTGPQGPKGDKGDTGATGATGAQGIQGVQGEKGEKGDKGDTGESGITTPANGFFTLSVDADGNLWAYSADDGTTPDFEYDSDTGNLYVVQEVA